MTSRPLVIVGPSGVGKTTVVTEILETTAEFSYVRSATTRKRRGDAHDREYIYLSRDEFLLRVERGEMLEYMEYGENLYGTPRSELERIESEGRIPLLILDIVGAESLRRAELRVEPYVVYIWDELNVIEKRLYARELTPPTAEGLESFIKRKTANIRDYLSMGEKYSIFDAFVKNTTVAECVSEILTRYREEATPDRESNAETARLLVSFAEAK